MWVWVREQIDKHFADVLLVALIFGILFVIISNAMFRRVILHEPPIAENMAWAREVVSSIIGCLLGRLARIDAKSNGHTSKN